MSDGLVYADPIPGDPLAGSYLRPNPRTVAAALGLVVGIATANVGAGWLHGPHRTASPVQGGDVDGDLTTLALLLECGPGREIWGSAVISNGADARRSVQVRYTLYRNGRDVGIGEGYLSAGPGEVGDAWILSPIKCGLPGHYTYDMEVR